MRFNMLIDTVISSYVKITLTNEKRVLFVSLIEKKKKKRKKREIENNSVSFSLYTRISNPRNTIPR